MAGRSPYSNAPIVEAILEIQCAPGEGVVVDTLASIPESEAERYPHKQRIDALKAEFKAQLGSQDTPEFAGTATRTPSGFVSTSADRLQLFQATITGFVFARLKPYLGWEMFGSEARRLWACYRTLARPKSIHRVGIRTINRLEFPAPVADPRVYLRTLPTIGESVGKTIESFFMQVIVPQPEIKGVSVITQTVDSPGIPDRLAIILDIDLSRTTDLPQDDLGLWALLEQMRLRKDDIFEGCITDKTREMFNA